MTAHVDGSSQAPGGHSPTKDGIVAKLSFRTLEAYRLSKEEGATLRSIAAALGYKDHTTVMADLDKLPQNIERAKALLKAFSEAGWGSESLARKQREAWKKAKENPLRWIGSTPPWGCGVRNGMLQPEVTRIRRLWRRVKRTKRPLQVAREFGFRHRNTLYHTLRNEFYLKIGAIDRETFDDVRRIMAINRKRFVLPPLGLRYDTEGNLTITRRFPVIVKIFRLRGRNMTLDDVAAKTGIDRSQVHRHLRKRKYKPFLDAIDPSLWNNAQKIHISPIGRIREWQKQQRRDILVKIRTKLSQGKTTAKILVKITRLHYSTLLGHYLKPLIESGEVGRVRSGNHVYYRLAVRPNKRAACLTTAMQDARF